MTLLQPKEITITSMEGEDRTYILSKIPAIPCREIITQYPLSAIPKLGDYKVNEALMLKLMAYVGVEISDGKVQQLTTQALIHNHVPDFEVLMKLEAAMIDYNCSFFTRGGGSTFFENITQKAKPLALKILMALQEQSSQKAEPPSSN